jgi:hypothetical protein
MRQRIGMDTGGFPSYGSGGQFGDELDGLVLRETTPVWLTQQLDEPVSMGTGTAPSGEIVHRPNWDGVAGSQGIQVQRCRGRGHRCSA